MRIGNSALAALPIAEISGSDIQSPEPEDYRDFSEESLRSFSFEAGGNVDVIWLPKQHIW